MESLPASRILTSMEKANRGFTILLGLVIYGVVTGLLAMLPLPLPMAWMGWSITRLLVLALQIGGLVLVYPWSDEKGAGLPLMGLGICLAVTVASGFVTSLLSSLAGVIGIVSMIAGIGALACLVFWLHQLFVIHKYLFLLEVEKCMILVLVVLFLLRFLPANIVSGASTLLSWTISFYFGYAFYRFREETAVRT